MLYLLILSTILSGVSTLFELRHDEFDSMMCCLELPKHFKMLQEKINYASSKYNEIVMWDQYSTYVRYHFEISILGKMLK